MRLTNEAFGQLQDALVDAFSSTGDFASLSRRSLGERLQDVTQEASLPNVARALIEFAESADAVPDLVREAKALNPRNQRLAAIDESKLQEAPSTAEVVDAGSGGASFKGRLKESLLNLDSPGLQVVAASELSQLLEAASDAEADTLYRAVLGNIKTDRPDEVLIELTPVLARSLRRRIGDGKRPDDFTLDLARTKLHRIDLSGLDLHEADFAFADLHHAKLTGTNLWRSRGYGVDVTNAGISRSNLEEARWHSAIARETRFHDCRMISAVLKEADLIGAEFQRARLQGAHFERSDLTGARFEQANLADADFRGAKIDEVAASSIARAVSWSTARFDPETRALIEGGAPG